ncbi:MAG: hypothetical protein KJN63_00955, partial [Acidimicrobiia bacterium]|nr:hypothetical protein [Acidimicrobiia bacterium]
MSELPAPLVSLVADSPPVTEAYDTSTPLFATYVDRVEADLSTGPTGSFAEIDEHIRHHAPNAVGLRIALKIAESRAAVREFEEPVTVTLLNPVYKETGRMMPRSEHPHGEDSIRYKAAALDRIASINPNVETRLIVIDDGCPDGSGSMAADILAGLDGWQERHEVLY